MVMRRNFQARPSPDTWIRQIQDAVEALRANGYHALARETLRGELGDLHLTTLTTGELAAEEKRIASAPAATLAGVRS